MLSPASKHEDWIPIIKDKILLLCKRKKGWVLFNEIHHGLLKDGTVKLLIGKDLWKHEGRKTVSNNIAWFSQKITEYENGTIRENYKQFDLIKETHSLFDRRRLGGGRYEYKLRDASGGNPQAKSGRAAGENILKQRRSEEKNRQEEFSKFVENLNKQKRAGELSGEDFREHVRKWQQRRGSDIQNGRTVAQ